MAERRGYFARVESVTVEPWCKNGRRHWRIKVRREVVL